jgi:predicted permease
MSLRAALGAGRGTLLRQLITESGVLAVAGGVVGVLVGAAAIRAAFVFVPDHYAMGRVAQVRMDFAVLAFTLVTGLAVTLVAGLGPAVHAARSATAGSSRATTSRTTGRFREALVVAEIALALVLLIGTVLLIRTFLVLRPASPGFDPDDRLVASVTLPENTERSDAERVEFARRLKAALQTGAPGARGALASEVPLSGLIARVQATDVDGEPLAEGRTRAIDVVSATPGYFDVIGMRLARGRALLETDLPGSMPVAVMNESAALRFWPDEEPIGRRIGMLLYGRTVSLTVVGIVQDTRSNGGHTRTSPTAFVSFWQIPRDRFHLVLHQPDGAFPAEDAIRNIVATVDPLVPVRDIQPMRRMVARAVAEPRYHMILMTSFGGLALLLATVGCYGMLSYTVAQRTREIGVRVALGAPRGRIVRDVVSRAAALIAIGIAAGAALASALARVLGSTLYGVTPTDPVSYGIAAAAIALVSLLAAYLPARRAAAVPPITALAAE